MSETAEEPTVIDELAIDATLEKAEYPKGAPKLIPYLQLRPRSRRAEFKRKFAELETVRTKIEKLRKTGVLDSKNTKVTAGDQMRASAELDDLMQTMDDLMLLAADDPAGYRRWSDALTDDNDLTLTFNAFMRSTSPGEASSSAS